MCIWWNNIYNNSKKINRRQQQQQQQQQPEDQHQHSNIHPNNKNNSNNRSIHNSHNKVHTRCTAYNITIANHSSWIRSVCSIIIAIHCLNVIVVAIASDSFNVNASQQQQQQIPCDRTRRVFTELQGEISDGPAGYNYTQVSVNLFSLRHAFFAHHSVSMIQSEQQRRLALSFSLSDTLLLAQN